MKAQRGITAFLVLLVVWIFIASPARGADDHAHDSRYYGSTVTTISGGEYIFEETDVAPSTSGGSSKAPVSAGGKCGVRLNGKIYYDY